MIIRRLPVPATFLVVVSVVVFLIIFFGAWAAAAAVSDEDRGLYFGFAGATVAPGSETGESGQAKTDLPGSTDDEGAGTEQDASWWGNAFLKACPFH